MHLTDFPLRSKSVNDHDVRLNKMKKLKENGILIITAILACAILLAVFIQQILIPAYLENLRKKPPLTDFIFEPCRRTIVESVKELRAGELLGCLLANAIGKGETIDLKKLINEKEYSITDKEILKHAPEKIKTFDLPQYLLEDLSYSKNGFKDKDGNVWIIVYQDKEKKLYACGNFDSNGEQQVKVIKNDAVLEKSLAD